MTNSPTLRPQPKSGILEISPYVPGKSHAKGDQIFKLSSNESPFGASPSAIEAYAAASNKLAFYPEGTAKILREALAQRYGLNPDFIVCGAGSDELLQLLAHAYLGEGDEAIYSQYGFLVYPIAIHSNGAKAIIAPEKNLTTDVDAILRALTPKTRMVFLANPNNPTGTYLPFDEIKRLHAGLPKTVLLVLDAAYAEYVQRNDYECGIALVTSAENVVMTRTFSKIYGLASLRIGWAYGPPHIIDVLNRIRGPFNVSAAAMLAATAALSDHNFITQAITHNEQSLSMMNAALSTLGLNPTPSVGNFILVHFATTGNHTARAADQYLQEQGIIVRQMEAYGLPHALRISVGSEAANTAVITALTRFLSAQKS